MKLYKSGEEEFLPWESQNTGSPWDAQTLCPWESDNDEERWYREKRRKKKRKQIALGLLTAALLGGLALLLLGGEEQPEVLETLPQLVDTVSRPEILSPVVPIAAPEEDSMYYFRSLLTQEEKQDYDSILQAVIEHRSEIAPLTSADHDQLNRVFLSVYYDHPELFWIDGSYTTRYNDAGIVSMKLKYVMDETERSRVQREIDQKVAPLIQQLSPLSEYEKALGVYTYIIENSYYQLYEGHTSIARLLLKGWGKCSDYALTTSYLLNQLGMQSLYISGEALDDGVYGSHGWNIVRIDGNYYQVDTTWGDPVMDDGSQRLEYGFLCLSTQQMSEHHRADDLFVLPDCNDSSKNYYVMNDRYLDAYDEQKLVEWMSQNSPEMLNLTFQCASQELLEETKAKLFDQKRMQTLWKAAYPETPQLPLRYKYSDSAHTMQIVSKERN